MYVCMKWLNFEYTIWWAQPDPDARSAEWGEGQARGVSHIPVVFFCLKTDEIVSLSCEENV